MFHSQKHLTSNETILQTPLKIILQMERLIIALKLKIIANKTILRQIS